MPIVYTHAIKIGMHALQKQNLYFSEVLQLRDYPYYANFMNAVGADTWGNFTQLTQNFLQALHLSN